MSSPRIAFVALMLVSTAGAQANPNTTGTPLYGTITLNAGFTPDPKDISLSAGGDTDVDSLSLPSHCTGHIVTTQPDLRLHWTAGSSPLRIAVCAGADTSLIINDANGNWHCDDDTEGENPVLSFNGVSGQFDIWVGTYSAGAAQPATLRLSERGGTLCH